MGKWRNLSIEFAVSLLGYRGELDIVPFQWARPQIGFSRSLGREKRLPSFKFGPLHFWTMTSDKVEISMSMDLRAMFHSHVFQRVYPDSFVWPDYRPRTPDA